MRFPLDIAFLDANRAIVAAYPSLPPGSRTHWHRNAVHALELPAGTLEDSGTVTGDVLAWALQPASASRDIPRRTEAIT